MTRGSVEHLAPDECHLFILRVPETMAMPVVTAYEALLTEEEARRYRSFHFEKHRHLFLATRGLVRTTLSRYAAVEPERWRFASGSHGKPYIAAPELPLPLSFNLSNTDGMVVCAVARGVAIGVDVEHTERLSEPMGIAHRFFSPREFRDLCALPAGEQRHRFFAYWTLKEAYIKGRGLGLAIPLEQFSFVWANGGIRLVLDARLQDDADTWQCERIEIEAPHALAILIQRGKAPDFAVRIHDLGWLPAAPDHTIRSRF